MLDTSGRAALGVSISGDGVVAILVRAPGMVIGLYRASPQFLNFLGLTSVLRDAVAHLQVEERTPICLVRSQGFSDEISEQLCGSLASRIDVVRPSELPSAKLVAPRRTGRALDEHTDVAALAAASNALDRVVGLRAMDKEQRTGGRQCISSH